MEKQEIAKVLLDRRSLNPVVMQGELSAKLGSDGMAEALRLRWVQPDYDTGHLQITNHQSTVNELRKLAQESADSGPGRIPATGSHDAAVSHSNRRLNEIAAPATGKPAPSMTAEQPPAQATSTPPAPPVPGAPKDGQPSIGDNVMVAEDGKTYQGKVQSLKPNGSYVVSFGNEKPVRPRDYKQDEVRLMQKAAVETGAVK